MAPFRVFTKAKILEMANYFETYYDTITFIAKQQKNTIFYRF